MDGMIKVFCDGEQVFCGSAAQMLADNDGDEDVEEMLEEAINNGTVTRRYFSGEWTVIAG